MLTDPPDPPYSYVMTQRDFVATRGDFEDALRGDYYLALRNATHATKPPLVCACFTCAVQSLHWNRCVLRRRASSFARGSSASTATPCTVRARKRARCMRVCVRVCVCVCVCVRARVRLCWFGARVCNHGLSCKHARCASVLLCLGALLDVHVTTHGVSRSCGQYPPWTLAAACPSGSCPTRRSARRCGGWTASVRRAVSTGRASARTA